jgi:hypothetical protein
MLKILEQRLLLLPYPTMSQSPVIDPLTDPFMWSDGSGRSLNFNDWKRRRNEIKKEIEHYEIGLKPDRPQDITATYTPTSATAGHTQGVCYGKWPKRLR